MTQQINGMVRERLINCDTHFDNGQIEAVMEVVEQSGYSELYDALKAIDGYLSASFPANLTRKKHAVELLDKALAKAEGRNEM